MMVVMVLNEVSVMVVVMIEKLWTYHDIESVFDGRNEVLQKTQKNALRPIRKIRESDRKKPTSIHHHFTIIVITFSRGKEQLPFAGRFGVPWKGPTPETHHNTKHSYNSSPPVHIMIRDGGDSSDDGMGDGVKWCDTDEDQNGVGNSGENDNLDMLLVMSS